MDKVRDIVGFYLSLPDRAPVLCVSEKSQILEPDRTRSAPLVAPGMVERQTHDYRRNGTRSPFATFATATGFVVGECYKHHRTQESLIIDSFLPPPARREGGPAAELRGQKV